ncbi:hypothetical protein B0H34DRAFT_668287, partial [Crassisporium funariophilum]
ATLEELRIAQEFIAALQDTTLDNGDLPPEVVDRIRNPLTHKLNLDDDLAMRTRVRVITHELVTHMLGTSGPLGRLLTGDVNTLLTQDVWNMLIIANNVIN